MATTPPSLQEGKTGKPTPTKGKPLGLLECREGLLGSNPENSFPPGTLQVSSEGDSSSSAQFCLYSFVFF